MLFMIIYNVGKSQPVLYAFRNLCRDLGMVCNMSERQVKVNRFTGVFLPLVARLIENSGNRKL